MHLNKGNRWEGKGGMGRVSGVQCTSNLDKRGRERATAQRRDFQVSKRGISKKGCEHAPQCIYHANK
jgi:hypothetical protein